MTTKPAIAANDDEIDLAQIAGRIWSSRWIIAATSATGLLLGLIYGAYTPPVYQADALLQLEGRSAGLALSSEMQALLGESESRVLTEIDIIRSRMVLGQVVDAMELDVVTTHRPPPIVGDMWGRIGLPDPGIFPKYAWDGDERIDVEDLLLPSNWSSERLLLTVRGNDTFEVTLPNGQSLQGKVGDPLNAMDGGFRLHINDLAADDGRIFEIATVSRPSLVADLRDRLSVTETGRQSSVLRLELTAPAPEEAEATLNALLDAYLTQNVTRSAAEAQSSLDFIDSQLPVAQATLTAAEEALNQYRQSQQSVDIDYETSSLLSKVTDLERQLGELQLLEEDYKRRFTPNHPTYQALLQDRRTLTEQLEVVREESLTLPETQKQVFNLTRNLEVAQQVYMALLSRQQELRVIQASAIGNIRVLDRAYASVTPIAPRHSRIVALSTLLGLIGGAAWVLASHALRRAVQSAEDIERLGLPVFATIGHSEVAASINSKRSKVPILAVTRPSDLAIEALRALRTALHFGMLDARSKAVVITSSAPGAGKSFISTNLAVVAAQAGQRVCLVDGDLRRGYLRSYFGLPKGTPGLAELLSGDASLEAVSRATEIDGLTLITTGYYPPNPSELLMRREFTDLLEALDARFDLIIIDAPPTLAVTDPVIMARNAGSALCVARHHETAIPEVEAVMAAFATAGAKLSGGIVNGVKASGSGYGTRYYYYNQRYGYDRDTDPDR